MQLVFTTHALDRVLHVCAADDPATGETIVITLYEPDPSKWEADLRRRKP